MKITYEGIVTAQVINKKTGEVISTHTAKNTLVEGGENFIANLLNKSFVLSNVYPVTPINFIDYMSIGAGYKLAVNSADDSHIKLPYAPINGTEDVTTYDGLTVWAISGPNQGQSLAVATNGYAYGSRILTLVGHFTNTPLAGEVYVVGTSTLDNQLNGEGEADEAGHTILNPKQPIVSNSTHPAPFINETEIRAERVESEGTFVASEAALRYNLTTNTAGHSSTHYVPGTMFAKANFGNNPPHKSASDILQVRRTLRVGIDRTP